MAPTRVAPDPGRGASGAADARPFGGPLRPLWRGVRRLLPPERVARLQYRRRHGAWPDLEAPRTFNEKVMRRKLRDRDPQLVAWTDRIEAKRLVADLVSPDLVVPTFWAGHDPDEAPLELRRPPYVCKAAHGRDMSLFVRGPEDVRPDAIRGTMRHWLAKDYADVFLELHYRQIARRLLVERMLEGERPIEAWKLFVFGGTVQVIWLERTRDGVRHRATLDRDWNSLDMAFPRAALADPGPPPAELPEMFRGAERIGAGFDFVRVDLHRAEERIWFSAATFTPGAGLLAFRPGWDLRLGEMWPTGHPAPQA